MNTIMEPKYTGDGGVAQRNFIQDALVGRKVSARIRSFTKIRYNVYVVPFSTNTF